MSQWEFPGSEPIEAFIELAAGSVALTAKATDVTTVSLAPSRFARNGDKLLSEVRVSFDNGRLEVVGPKRTGLWRAYSPFDLTITLPPGPPRPRPAAPPGRGNRPNGARPAPGGAPRPPAAPPTPRAVPASGAVRAEETGEMADARTVSGDPRITRASGDIQARTASGDVSIATA